MPEFSIIVAALSKIRRIWPSFRGGKSRMRKGYQDKPEGDRTPVRDKQCSAELANMQFTKLYRTELGGATA